MNSIIQILRDNCPTLKAKYPLVSLGVFGSYSREEETSNSDLDIVYETLPDTFLDLHNYLGLQRDLSAITQLKIELVNKRKMNEVIWIKAQKDIIYV
jgi:predicted nucleotidyltransferase